MTAFQILTDSNCHVPPPLSHELGIHVVPLPLVWEGQTYSDGMDIPPSEFYQRLRTARESPKTSAPTPGTFIEAIRELEGRQGVLHSDAEPLAWELKAAAEERFHPEELIVQQLNPILAIHAGPGAFGLAYSSGLQIAKYNSVR